MRCEWIRAYLIIDFAIDIQARPRCVALSLRFSELNCRRIPRARFGEIIELGCRRSVNDLAIRYGLFIAYLGALLMGN